MRCHEKIYRFAHKMQSIQCISIIWSKCKCIQHTPYIDCSIKPAEIRFQAKGIVLQNELKQELSCLENKFKLWTLEIWSHFGQMCNNHIRQEKAMSSTTSVYNIIDYKQVYIIQNSLDVHHYTQKHRSSEKTTFWFINIWRIITMVAGHIYCTTS